MISGTVVKEGAISKSYTYWATDGQQSAPSRNFEICIYDTAPEFTNNQGERLEQSTAVTLTRNQLGAHQLPEARIINPGSCNLSDQQRGELPDSEPTYSLMGLPEGLFFHASSRNIFGTPTTVTSSPVNLTYTVTDADSNSDSLAVTLSVVDNVLRSDEIEPIEIGIRMSVNRTLPVFTGGSGNPSYSLLDRDMNVVTDARFTELGFDGLSYDSETRTISGMVSGTSQVDSEIETFHHRATDANGSTATTPFTIDLTDSIPVAPAAALYTFEVGESLTELSASLPSFEGGDKPLIYILYDGVVPVSATTNLIGGIRYDNAAARFTGTVSAIEAGSSSSARYTYKLRDADGDERITNVTITIVDELMQSATIGDKTITVGTPIPTINLPAFTGGSSPLTYTIEDMKGNSVSTGKLKKIGLEGLELNLNETTNSMDGSTFIGTITGTLAGTNADDNGPPKLFVLRAEDAKGRVGTTPFSITIKDSLPSFGEQTIDDFTLVRYVFIDDLYDDPDIALTLPEVSSGTGTGDIAYSISTLPLYFSFDPPSRRLSGFPITEGSNAITYTATDEDGDAVALTFNIVVEGDNTPAFSNADIDDIIATENIEIEDVTLPAATGGNAPVTYSFHPPLPTGLNFDQNTRTLSGTPAALSYQIATPHSYIATDVDGDSTLTPVNFIITINRGGLTSDPIPTTPITVGVAITPITLPAITGGRGTITYTLVRKIENADDEVVMGGSSSIDLASIDLPGLTYNAPNGTNSGTISGIFTDAEGDSSGPINLIHRAVDSDGRMGSTEFTISITDPQPSFGEERIEDITVVINTALPTRTLPEVESGTASNYSLSPALPDGLTFNSTSRVLSGTPTALKDKTTYTYTATDGDGDTASLTFTLSVVDRVMQLASAIGTNGTIAVTVGEQVTQTLPEFMGGVGPYTYSLVDVNGNIVTALSSINSGLDGLTYDRDSHTIGGRIADKAGDQSITDPIILKHCAVDSIGNIGSVIFKLMVEDRIPSFGDKSIEPIVAIRNAVFSTVTLPELETGTYTGTPNYSLSHALPTGLTFNATTRVISGTPTALTTSANSSYTYTAREGVTGDSASHTFTLAVTTSPLVSERIQAINAVVSGEAVNRVLPTFTGGTDTLTHSVTDEYGNDITNESRWAELGLEGLSYDSTTRIISGTLVGTPNNDSRTVTLKHRAVDSNGAVATRSFQVIVEDSIPSFGDTPSSIRLQVRRGSRFSRSLPQVVKDVDSDQTTYSLTRNRDHALGTAGLPAGLGWFHRKADSGVYRSGISGNTMMSAQEIYTYTALDTDGDTVSLSITLSVVESGLQIIDQSSYTTYPLYIGQTINLPFPSFRGGIGHYTYNITDLNGVELNETHGFRDMTYDDTSSTFSGTYVGTPANDNGYINLRYRIADANGEVVKRFSFYVSSDKSPTFDTSDFSNEGLSQAIIDGELVNLPRLSVYVADNIVTRLPKVVSGSGNEPITYSLTDTHTGLKIQFAGLEHNPIENALVEIDDVPLYSGSATVTATDTDGDTASFVVSINSQRLSFGNESINIPTLTQGVAMTSVTLPVATAASFYSPLAYSLRPELPVGLTFNPMTRSLSGTPSETLNITTYTYTATSTKSGSSRNTSNLSFTIEVQSPMPPSFGNATIEDKTYPQNLAISPITLPVATAGTDYGELTYSLSPAVPVGLAFDANARELSGAPTTVQSAIEYTYIATSTRTSTVSTPLTFTIEIEARLRSKAIGTFVVTVGEEVSTMVGRLPAFTGGVGDLDYSLVDVNGNVVTALSSIHPDLAGLTYDSDVHTISGRITDTRGDQSIATPIIFKHCAVDTQGHIGSVIFTLTVTDDRLGFGDQRIDPIVAIVGTALTHEALPEADVDTLGAITYRVIGSLPTGLNFNPNTREISGTPTEVSSRATTYTYTANAGSSENVAMLSFSVAVTTSPLVSERIQPINVVVNGEVVSRVLLAFTGGSDPLTHSLTDKYGNDITNESRWEELGLGGLSYDPATHTISGTLAGTPNNDDSGTVTLKHKAVDANGAEATRSFQVIVHDPMPSFGEAPSSLKLQAQRGEFFRRLLPRVVEGTEPGSIRYSLTGSSSSGSEALPAGFEFETNYTSSEIWDFIYISGTASATSLAETYTYTATDYDGDSASISITFSVAEDALRPSGFNVTGFEVLQEYTRSYAITLEPFVGGKPHYTYSLTDADGVEIDDLGTLIEGLRYDPNTLTISGIPTGTTVNDSKKIAISHKAVDQNGIEAVARLNINVADRLPRFDNNDFQLYRPFSSSDGMKIIVYPLDDGSVNRELPQVFSWSGTRTAYAGISYSLNSPIPGVILNHATNHISGRYNGEETSRIVTATDADGDTASFTLEIIPVRSSFREAPISDGGVLTLTQGMPFSIVLPEASTTAGNSTFGYTLSNCCFVQNDLYLPSGMLYNSDTRRLYGTPTSLRRSREYQYNALAGGILWARLVFTIEVVAPPAPEPDSDSEMMPAGLDETIGLSPPVVEEVMVMSGREMALVVLPDFGYSGPYRLTYSVTGLPQGVEFTPATRMLSGTPQAIGVNEVVYTATDEVGNSGATLFTLTVMDAMLTDATRSAIPAVSTSVAMAATASVASRISQALSGATRGLDITTASGQRFQFDPSSSSGSSGSGRDPLRFGFWFNTATDELSDTRYDVSTNSTTESSNFGFDVSLDFNPDTTLVLGVMQNNSTTETEFRGVGALSTGVGSEGSLALDLNSTALYAALGWRGFSLWAASGDNNTYVAGTTSDVGLPAAFSYQTVGFSADFEVFEDLRIGARVETLQSDFSVPGQGRQLLGDLASASSHTKATLTLNYQLELGRESNGLLTPSFEFGTRDLSTTEQFQTTRSNARDTASELGFGLDYKQLAWGLTLGLDVSSMAVQNYSSQSVRWSVRWESGHHGKGLSLSLAPTTVAQTLGVDNIYNGDYGSYKSLVNRQFSDDSAVSGEGVNVEMGIGFLSGTGTFTPFVKATNLYGSGASTQAFGVRYSAASSTSFELKFTQQSRASGLGGSGNSLTLGDTASGASSSRDDLEQALEFSTRYSF